MTINRVVSATLVAVACAALVPGGVATAAAKKNTCRLETIAGSQQVHVALEYDTELLSLNFRAMWMATTSCSDPGSPLDGQTVDLMQMARLRPHGHGMVGGPTHLGIIFDDGTGPHVRQFDGQVRGTFDCQSDLCQLELTLNAGGPRGTQLLGHERLLVNRVTGEPGPIDPGFDLIWLPGNY